MLDFSLIFNFYFLDNTNMEIKNLALSNRKSVNIAEFKGVVLPIKLQLIDKQILIFLN